MSNHITILHSEEAAYKPNPRSGNRAIILAQAQKYSTQQKDNQPQEVKAEQVEISTITLGEETIASKDNLYRKGKGVDGTENDPESHTRAQKAAIGHGHEEKGVTGASKPPLAVNTR